MFSKREYELRIIYFLRIAISLREKHGIRVSEIQTRRNAQEPGGRRGPNPAGTFGDGVWAMGKSQRKSFLHLILLGNEARRQKLPCSPAGLCARNWYMVVHLYSPVYNLVSSRSKTSRGNRTAHPQLASGRGGGKATSHLQSCRARPGSDGRVHPSDRRVPRKPIGRRGSFCGSLRGSRGLPVRLPRPVKGACQTSA